MGEERSYSVCTWLGRDKAVAIAGRADLQWHDEQGDVYEVVVEELGPAKRTDAGTASAEGEDLVDRFGW